MDRGVWWAHSPWGCKELNTTEHTHTHQLVRTNFYNTYLSCVVSLLFLECKFHKGRDLLPKYLKPYLAPVVGD